MPSINMHNDKVITCSVCEGPLAPGHRHAECREKQLSEALRRALLCYERRIRSDCSTPEQLAAKPWECDDYIFGVRVLAGSI